MLSKTALIMPPSAASEKVTPVALGLMPKPKLVNRLLLMAELFVSDTATVSALVLNPERVSVPAPFSKQSTLKL